MLMSVGVRTWFEDGLHVVFDSCVNQVDWKHYIFQRTKVPFLFHECLMLYNSLPCLQSIFQVKLNFIIIGKSRMVSSLHVQHIYLGKPYQVKEKGSLTRRHQSCGVSSNPPSWSPLAAYAILLMVITKVVSAFKLFI